MVTCVTALCSQAFTILGKKRDGITDKSDLRDALAGWIGVSNMFEERSKVNSCRGGDDCAEFFC